MILKWLLFIAAPAWAGTSLIAGQPLEYNHAYKCKGERIIVAHCRDEDDASFCQTVYPDRPFVNGNQVAPIEIRGDVVAMLNACNQTASAPAQAQKSAPAAAATSGPVHVNKGAVPVPGVGQAKWWLLDYNHNMAVFFTKERIKRTGTSGEGWFTSLYADVQDISDTTKGVQYLQVLYKADCKGGTFTIKESAYLNEDGNVITGVTMDTPPKRPDPGTFAEEQVNVICGKPQKLITPTAYDGEGHELMLFYKELLDRRGQ